MTYLILYPLLSTASKRALRRRTKRFGKPYHYTPQARLVKRLALEKNMTETEITNQLLAERAELLSKENEF